MEGCAAQQSEAVDIAEMDLSGLQNTVSMRKMRILGE